MGLLRNSTVKQLDKIEKEINKQGGNLDLSHPEEKNMANSLWVHDPFKANRDGVRKLSTIDDHMKIDIPDASEQIKKFSDFKTNEKVEIAENNTDREIKTMIEWEKNN